MQQCVMNSHLMTMSYPVM